jgi:hypothetical protein
VAEDRAQDPGPIAGARKFILYSTVSTVAVSGISENAV